MVPCRLTSHLCTMNIQFAFLEGKQKITWTDAIKFKFGLGFPDTEMIAI